MKSVHIVCFQHKKITLIERENNIKLAYIVCFLHKKITLIGRGN